MDESMPVNWEVLDALVVDFATSEHLIADHHHPSSSATSSPSSCSSPSTSSSSSSSYQHRLLIRHVRRYLEAGDVDSAVDLLRVHAPSVLHDHRLLFRLHKQKFIELLRRGTLEDRDSAIRCLQTSLAPCALNAYPEAYEEFKHALLAFIFDKDDQNSPVVDEWSKKRRFDIAGLMSSVLRAHLQAYDPILSMSLRYLISIHKGFCFSQGISSPISDLTARLLLEEHDPPAIPQESLCEAPPFDEVDIQALAQAVQLTRQGAVDSLRFAKGDLFQAFQNELCHMRMNDSMFDDLVYEYCVYRGIVVPNLSSSSASEMEIVSKPPTLPQQDSDNSLTRNGSLDVECSTNNHCMEGSNGTSADVISSQSFDNEAQDSIDIRKNHENCSTSGTEQFQSLKLLRRNRSCEPRDRCKRKRWMGRQDKLDLISDKQAFEMHKIVDLISTKEDNYETVLAVKELACQGMAAEVIEKVNIVDPNFFTENHLLLFQLKQVEFLKLVSFGDLSGALKVARSHLGPLAAGDPALLNPLKGTLLALLSPDEVTLDEGLPLHALATSLQVAIGKRLGIEEPQLMKIMKATLYTHSEWFKLQMCNDRFEGFLKIEPLKEVVRHLLTKAPSKSNTDDCTPEYSQGTLSSASKAQDDCSSTTQVSSTEAIYDDNAILKVMEFLDLPRAEAIHLLALYNGNAETVIQQLFA